MARQGKHQSGGEIAVLSTVGPRLALLLCVLALTLLGFVMIYSASSIKAITEQVSDMSYMFDQVKFAVIGTYSALSAVTLSKLLLSPPS